MREDYRLFSCARCGRQMQVCPHCDRGQRYCGQGCSGQARRQSQREAGRRYQATPRGRRFHARRQICYLIRREKRPPAAVVRMTHQGSPPPVVGSRLSARPGREARVEPREERWGQGEAVRCSFCGAPCRPWARFEFLRWRRRWHHRRP